MYALRCIIPQDEEDYLSAHPQEQHLQTFFDLIEQGDIDDAEKVLITQALNVNARQEANGPTALHLATGKNDSAAIQMLLRHGADKSVTLNGLISLEIATAVGASEAAELLA
jgi:ankyrin repeat protein